MDPRLGSWGLTPIGKYSKTGGAREELSPVQIKHRDYIFLILEIKETFPTTHVQKGPLKVKQGGWYQLPIGLFTGIHLG